ncbi:MAG TPA: Holliday junction branch migration protein RuvA [Chloroflexota bacterium]|nr:Holliday junction branch migration protein RuvA [Chloroflexota bacterium]
MYSYLRGLYKGHAPDNEEAIIVEAAGIGYEVFVPPIVDQEVSATYQLDDGLVLHVSAQSGRDQPWPVLFGFLTARQKSFWQLLISVPRVGGRVAARAMVAPVETIAEAIQQGNRAYLDGLPGITLDGADKMIASLRKKVGPFVQPAARVVVPRVRLNEADEMREDAIAILMQMGLKRLEAQRGVDQLLASRDDVVSVQDIVTHFLRSQAARAERSR